MQSGATASSCRLHSELQSPLDAHTRTAQAANDSGGQQLEAVAPDCFKRSVYCRSYSAARCPSVAARPRSWAN
ncbi:hypothetical protein B5X24_HaOG209638 [Helicoverpa armigera]|uniref:Uncharacterized protein n=1 Tax=Helicoverpa armigera TaxID=29058 RepID=A0A2W1BGI2_HELAM|nr:hypothetical protein B5X24_HaOG209638 [Helicoverpa armigera]